jgi:glycogen synthase
VSRILFWSELFLPDIGGVEVLSNHLIQSLQGQGHEFCVVTSHINRQDLVEPLDIPPAPIHRFPFRSAFANHDLSKIKEIVSTLDEIFHTFKPDLIHLNSQGISLFFLELVLKNNPSLLIPLIFSLHSPVRPPNLKINRRNPVNDLLMRCLFRASRVTAVSQAVFQDVTTTPAIAPRTSLILNGLPLPNLEPTPLPFDPPQLLCIGRVVLEKGFDLVVSALVQLRINFPEIRLIVAGNGPELLPLHQQIAALGISSAVDLLGWTSPEQIPALINTCTAVIMPSRWEEPFGLVALQAAQMARPIIASKVGGLPEVVVNQITGLLVEPDDLDGLTTAISTLLKKPQMAVQMGNTGRLRAQKNFNLDQCVHQYDALYRSVISSRT